MRSVRFDPALDERVRQAATREGVSVSEFIRAAAAERAATVLSGESLLDAMGDYVGSISVGGDSSRHKEEFAAAMAEKYELQQARRHAG